VSTPNCSPAAACPTARAFTYWPLAEIEPLATALDFEANRDEIALYTRRILERLAREQPLLVVFEDLQWAEPTFLDLIDHITDLARDAPMLLLCVARPELLDVRPGWGGGKLNATTMLLEALTDAESERLVDNLLARVDAGIKAQIASAAEGNPLFLEEMLAMVAEGRNGEPAIPPTIQALLAARLDRLGPDERTAVECAAVQGQEFRHDALAKLVPETLAGRLGEIHQSLVRKDLIRPAGEDTFRFKHLLLRDAAYEALPKEQRADLHERFAGWLETAAPELEEILGYHLEQAHRYLAELGPVDERGQRLARRASALLATAGQRALDRGDMHATTNLLERAIELLPSDDQDAVALYPDLATAVAERGELDRAEELLRLAEANAEGTTELKARVRLVMLETTRGMSMNVAAASLEEASAEAEGLGDAAVLAEIMGKRGIVASWLGDMRRAEVLLRRSLQWGQDALDQRQIGETTRWLALVLMWGPTHVDESLAECARLGDEANELSRSELLVFEGVLRALKSDFAAGRELAAEGRAILLDLGQTVIHAAVAMPAALVELLAGDADAAERLLREGREHLVASGERGYLSSVSALLAGSLCDQGRFDEAERFADEARELGAEDDWTTQMYWRAAKARILAARGLRDQAAHLATEIVNLAQPEDGFDTQFVFVQIAPFLEPDAARAALERALEAAERKGNVVSAARAREQLEALP
jgi:tetratricopeptide (TPR) repeat protein